MALSTTSSCQIRPILSPLHTNTSINSNGWLCPNQLSSVPLKAAATRRRTFIVALSYKSADGLAINKKREFLESYGLNPDEFLSEPSPKSRRRKDLVERGRGKPESSPQQSQPPRETHRLLQVLGGKVRRKKLLSPKGVDVRPMMEVVKAATFGILQAAGGSPASLRPGRWLDLYCGTGSVGIEAISRGCSEVHFVEMDPWVVSDVLRPNLESTGFLDVSVIHTARVENFLEQTEKFVDGAFDYISVTPPYMEVDYGILMNQVANSSAIGEDSFVVVEYPLKTEMLETCGCLLKIADRRFGRTHLAIYGPTWAQKKRKSKDSRQHQMKRV